MVLFRTVLIVFIVMIAAAGGCSNLARPVFEPRQVPLEWPGPPDSPRIRYVGELATTEDLHPRSTGWTRFVQILTGKRNWHQLVKPKDVAVYGNKLYVADPGQGAVVVFDLDRRETSVITGGDEAGLLGPTHLALDDTRLFVSDGQARCVVVLDHDGQYLSTWAKGQFERPAGLAWCQINRRLYVVDVVGHCIVVLDDKGQVVQRIGQRGAGPGQFNFPLWIRLDQELNLLVSDTINARVQRFSRDGKFLSSFGQMGDAAGNLSMPKGLACDSQGHIYVVDSRFENVQIFDPAGQLLLNFGTEGQEAGQFWLPEGIFIDRRDRIWVADTYNRRVQVFQYLSVEG